MKSPVSEPEEAAHVELRSKGREQMDAHGAYLERELAGGPWCLGETFSVADLYLYMLVGWESYIQGGYVLGGECVREHYRRVGERPAVVRTGPGSLIGYRDGWRPL